MRIQTMLIKPGMAVFITACMMIGLSPAPFPMHQEARAGRVLNDLLVAEVFSHLVWNDVVATFVDSHGFVNFNALKAHPLRLNHYLAQLEAYSPDSHPALFIDMRQRLAYWINAFNAIAMRLVLDAYPINAVTEIANYRASARYKLGGVPYSLDAIESRITREFSHIPEAYWALSDLTEDAPPLANRAYEAPALTEQLAFQARRYVGQPDTFEVASDCSSITISPYVQRFQPLLIAYIQKEKVGLPPDVSSYLALYADADTRGRLHRSCTATVYYKPYDTRVRAVVPLLK